MAVNPYNQIITQDYVPIPFQEMVYASGMRQKTGQQNMQDLGALQESFNALKAMPETEDYRKINSLTSDVNNIIQTASSDPKLLYDPLALQRVRQQLNSTVGQYGGRSWLNNSQESYAQQKADIDRRQALPQDQQNPLLYADWKGHDSRSGVWSGSSRGYLPSRKTSDVYIDNFLGDKGIDMATGLGFDRITPEDITQLSIDNAAQYQNTESFKNEKILAQAKGDKRSDDQLARDILYTDFKERLKNFDNKGLLKAGSAGVNAADVTPPDQLFTALNASETGAVNDIGRQILLGDKNQNGRYNVALGPDEGVVNFASDITSDLKEQAALSSYQKLEQANKLTEALTEQLADAKKPKYEHDTEAKSYRIVDADPAKVADLEARLKKAGELTAERKKAIEDMGYTGADIESLKGKYTKKYNEERIKDNQYVQMAVAAGGQGEFVPTSGKDNIVNVKNQDGTVTHAMSGQLVFTKEQGDAMFEQARLDNKGSWFDGDWGDRFTEGNKPLITKAIMPGVDGKDVEMYSMPYFKKVSPGDSGYDEANRAMYGAEATAKFANAWREGRNQHYNEQFDQRNRQYSYEHYSQNPKALMESTDGSESIMNRFATSIQGLPEGKERKEFEGMFNDYNAKINSGKVSKAEVEKLYNAISSVAEYNKTPIWQSHNNVGNIIDFTNDLDSVRTKYGDKGATLGKGYTGPNGEKGHYIIFSKGVQSDKMIPKVFDSKIYKGMTIDAALRKYSGEGYGADILGSIDPKTPLSDVLKSDMLKAYLTAQIVKHETGQ